MSIGWFASADSTPVSIPENKSCIETGIRASSPFPNTDAKNRLIFAYSAKRMPMALPCRIAVAENPVKNPLTPYSAYRRFTVFIKLGAGTFFIPFDCSDNAACCNTFIRSVGVTHTPASIIPAASPAVKSIAVGLSPNPALFIDVIISFAYSKERNLIPAFADTWVSMAPKPA